MPTTDPIAAFQSNGRSPSLRLLARISQYELLSRMWSDKSGAFVRPQALPPVFSRDFAYPDSEPMLMSDGGEDISQASATDFAELLSGPTVEVTVGKARRRWTLHKKLLCHQSAYFESALMNGEAAKAKKPLDQKLEFLQDDPAGFELFVKWLYQGRLNDTAELNDEQKYDHAVACHKLYVLCERFQLPELKNLSMDQYRQCLSEAQLVPDAEEINDIYKSSPQNSPFRKLMVQIAARQIMDPDSDKDAESYRACFQDNPDFAVQMVNAIRKGSGGMLFDDPTDGEGCEYHDHSEGAACRHRPRVKVPGSRSPRSNGEDRGSSDTNGRVSSDTESSPEHINNNINGVKQQPVRHVRFDDRHGTDVSDRGGEDRRLGGRRADAATPNASPSKQNGQGSSDGDGSVFGDGVDGYAVGGGSGEAEGQGERRKPVKLRRSSPNARAAGETE